MQCMRRSRLSGPLRAAPHPRARRHGVWGSEDRNTGCASMRECSLSSPSRAVELIEMCPSAVRGLHGNRTAERIGSMTGSFSGRFSWLRAFVATVGVFVAVNVVLSVVALVAKLSDLPHTHATTDHIGVGTVLWGDGSIISPPFVFMAVVGLMLWGALSGRTWLSRICTSVIVLGVVVMAVDEYSGDGGLKSRPHLYSHAKRDLALALGWVFIAAAVFVTVSGLSWLVSTIVQRPAQPLTT